MATLDEIRAIIDSYPPVLTSGALMRIAEQEGWREDRSEGSHRIFINPSQPSYGHITFKCHHEGADCDRIVTRQRLTEIYQPACDRAAADDEQQAKLRQTINQLETVIAQCEADFSWKADRNLKELQKRLDQYETAYLEDCEQAILGLMDDHQGSLLSQKQAELQQANQVLGVTQRQIKTLQAKQQSLRESLMIAHQNLERSQQQVRMLQRDKAALQESLTIAHRDVQEQTTLVQEKQRDLTIAHHQIAVLQRALREKDAQLESTNNQAIYRFLRDRRIGVMGLVLLGVTSAVMLRACYFSPMPVQPVPAQR